MRECTGGVGELCSIFFGDVMHGISLGRGPTLTSGLDAAQDPQASAERRFVGCLIPCDLTSSVGMSRLLLKEKGLGESRI